MKSVRSYLNPVKDEVIKKINETDRWEAARYFGEKFRGKEFGYERFDKWLKEVGYPHIGYNIRTPDFLSPEDDDDNENFTNLIKRVVQRDLKNYELRLKKMEIENRMLKVKVENLFKGGLCDCR